MMSELGPRQAAIDERECVSRIAAELGKYVPDTADGYFSMNETAKRIVRSLAPGEEKITNFDSEAMVYLAQFLAPAPEAGGYSSAAAHSSQEVEEYGESRNAERSVVMESSGQLQRLAPTDPRQGTPDPARRFVIAGHQQASEPLAASEPRTKCDSSNMMGALDAPLSPLAPVSESLNLGDFAWKGKSASTNRSPPAVPESEQLLTAENRPHNYLASCAPPPPPPSNRRRQRPPPPPPLPKEQGPRRESGERMLESSDIRRSSFPPSPPHQGRASAVQRGSGIESGREKLLRCKDDRRTPPPPPPLPQCEKVDPDSGRGQQGGDRCVLRPPPPPPLPDSNRTLSSGPAQVRWASTGSRPSCMRFSRAQETRGAGRKSVHFSGVVSYSEPIWHPEEVRSPQSAKSVQATRDSSVGPPVRGLESARNPQGRPPPPPPPIEEGPRSASWHKSYSKARAHPPTNEFRKFTASTGRSSMATSDLKELKRGTKTEPRAKRKIKPMLGVSVASSVAAVDARALPAAPQTQMVESLAAAGGRVKEYEGPVPPATLSATENKQNSVVDRPPPCGILTVSSPERTRPKKNVLKKRVPVAACSVNDSMQDSEQGPPSRHDQLRDSGTDPPSPCGILTASDPHCAKPKTAIVKRRVDMHHTGKSKSTQRFPAEGALSPEPGHHESAREGEPKKKARKYRHVPEQREVGEEELDFHIVGFPCTAVKHKTLQRIESREYQPGDMIWAKTKTCFARFPCIVLRTEKHKVGAPIEVKFLGATDDDYSESGVRTKGAKAESHLLSFFGCIGEMLEVKTLVEWKMGRMSRPDLPDTQRDMDVESQFQSLAHAVYLFALFNPKGRKRITNIYHDRSRLADHSGDAGLPDEYIERSADLLAAAWSLEDSSHITFLMKTWRDLLGNDGAADPETLELCRLNHQAFFRLRAKALSSQASQQQHG
jgi:hypothetical protein